MLTDKMKIKLNPLDWPVCYWVLLVALVAIGWLGYVNTQQKAELERLARERGDLRVYLEASTNQLVEYIVYGELPIRSNRVMMAGSLRDGSHGQYFSFDLTGEEAQQLRDKEAKMRHMVEEYGLAHYACKSLSVYEGVPEWRQEHCPPATKGKWYTVEVRYKLNAE